jgi:hypothetical protein
MLEHRFKSFCLISFYTSHKGVTNVEEYDKKSLYLMIVKCHTHLHLVSKSKVSHEDPMVEEDCSLEIFQQTTSINELVKYNLYEQRATNF